MILPPVYVGRNRNWKESELFFFTDSDSKSWILITLLGVGVQMMHRSLLAKTMSHNDSCYFHCRWGPYSNTMGNILGGQPQGLPLNIPVDQNALWTIVVISIVGEVPIVILWGTSWEGSLRVCLWTYPGHDVNFCSDLPRRASEIQFSLALLPLSLAL